MAALDSVSRVVWASETADTKTVWFAKVDLNPPKPTAKTIYAVVVGIQWHEDNPQLYERVTFLSSDRKEAEEKFNQTTRESLGYECIHSKLLIQYELGTDIYIADGLLNGTCLDYHDFNNPPGTLFSITVKK